MIPRSDRVNQRRQREKHRIIPRADNPDHSQWLVNDLGSRRKKIEARGDFSPLHPFGKVAFRVPDGVHKRRQFEQECFLPRAAAKIFVHRTNNFRLAFEYRSFQGLQRFEPLGIIGGPGMECGPLVIEQFS